MPIASDDFNRADGGIGANWTDVVDSAPALAIIESGIVQADTADGVVAVFWNADAFPDDQYSQVTVVATSLLGSNGVIVRASGTGASRNYYSARVVPSDGIELMKCVAGSNTFFGQFGSGGVDGDVARIAAIGTTIQCFLNNVQQGADLSDSALTSGSAGLRSGLWAGVGAVDDWSGGLAEAVPPLWIALGPQSGQTFAEDSSVGTISLTSPGNAAESDDTYVTFTLGPGETSHYLKVTDFQFAVPLTSDISGIIVEVEKSATAASAIQDEQVLSVKLVKGGAIAGENRPDIVAWPTTDAYRSHGDVDDTWGVSWTPADINAAGFGVVIAGTWLADATGRIDHVRITVYYVPAGQPQALGAQQFQVGDGMSTTERHSLIRQH